MNSFSDDEFARMKAVVAEKSRRAKVNALAAKCVTKQELHQMTKEAGLGSRSDDCSALARVIEKEPELGWKKVHRTRQMRMRIEAGL